MDGGDSDQARFDQALDRRLEETIKDFYRDLSLPSADWAVKLVHESDSALVIGSDPKEWWIGYSAICESWEESRRQYGGTILTATRLSISRYGNIGLATDEPRFEVAQASSSGSLRLTMIFIYEDEKWRLHHLHASAAVSDESLLAFGTN